MGFEKFVKFLGRFPAASVFIRIMGRRVFGLVFNDVHAAWGFDVQAEGTRAIAVPLHFLAVKLLEVKEQFAEAPFIIRNGFRITAQKINDIKLPCRFFQGNPVFQGVWNGDFRKGCTGGRSQKEQRKNAERSCLNILAKVGTSLLKTRKITVLAAIGGSVAGPGWE